jgi:hypothetical protein
MPSDPTNKLKNHPSDSKSLGYSQTRLPSQKLLGKITAKPYEQPRLSLGHFTDRSKLPGYMIELTPEPDPEDSITSEIMTVGSARHYELVLHVANYGQKSITAKVWQLH